MESCGETITVWDGVTMALEAAGNNMRHKLGKATRVMEVGHYEAAKLGTRVTTLIEIVWFE